VVEVRLELLRMRPVLHCVPATTTSYHEGTPRPIEALPEVKAMALLVIHPRVTQILPKAAAMRYDEGFNVFRTKCNRRFGLLVF
jgi:hypothetical protein